MKSDWSRAYPQAVPVMLGYAAMAAGLIYLLLRRAPVKGEGG